MISTEKSIDFLLESGYPYRMAGVAKSSPKSKRKRPRKRHVQQSLFRRGGKRKGAGRKPKGPRAGARHDSRPEIDETSVLHVVLRVVPEVGSLRRPALYQALRDASLAAAMRERIRIVHISVQRTHVHMLVEAEDKKALASRDARLPDFGGAEHQYGTGRQVRQTARQGIRGPVSLGGDHVAHAGTQCVVLCAQ